MIGLETYLQQDTENNLNDFHKILEDSLEKAEVNFIKTKDEAEDLYIDLSPKQREMLSVMHWHSKKHPKIYVSQSYIAKKVNCSREWVNKTFKLFVKVGFLQSEYRHLRTCLYKLGDFLKKDGLIDYLKSLFKRRKRSGQKAPESRQKNQENTDQFTQQFTQSCSFTKVKEKLYTADEASGYMPAKETPQVEVEIPEDLQVLAKNNLEVAITISAFPLPIRNECIEKINKMKEKGKVFSNLYGWGIKRMLERCKIQGITPDWWLKGKLLAKYGLWKPS